MIHLQFPLALRSGSVTEHWRRRSSLKGMRVAHAFWMRHLENDFCWAELAAADLPHARAFYSELFGWRFGESLGGVELASLGARRVAGLRELSPAMKWASVPAHWAVYVRTENMEAAIGRVIDAGGHVFTSADEQKGLAKTAAIRDRGGAFFGLYEARGSGGFDAKNEPGMFAWAELYTARPDDARVFYERVFGWTAEPHAGAMYPMWMLKRRDEAVGSIMQSQPEWGEVPEHWQIYFKVIDCDRSIERAQKLGASVLVPPITISNGGRFATLADTQGASFAILQDPC
jgi:uncharacterized protein